MVKSTEINNKGFNVERKSGVHWTQIGFVNGNGTTTQNHSYIYIDNTPDINSVNRIYYRLKQFDFDGNYRYSNQVELSFSPEGFSLSQNFPNPFNPITKIRYSIPAYTFTSLKIYDVLGDEITTLVSEEKPAGIYEVEFNASQLSSGFYVYRLVAGNFISTRKLLLIK